MDVNVEGYDIEAEQEARNLYSEHERIIVGDHLEQGNENGCVNDCAEHHDQVGNKGLIQRGVRLVSLADMGVEIVINKFSPAVSCEQRTVFFHNATSSFSRARQILPYSV